MKKELNSLLLELLSASDQYSYLLQEIIHIKLPLIALTTTLWVEGEYIDIVLILYWYCGSLFCNDVTIMVSMAGLGTLLMMLIQ